METIELIEDLRKQLKALEDKKESAVTISGLKGYLDVMEESSTSSKEYVARQHEGMLAEHSANTQWGTELFKAVVESGKSALHSVIIINGGAVIALMNVMSRLVGKLSSNKLAACLAEPMLYFGLGVLAGGLGFALRYISQAYYTADFNISNTNKYKLGGDIVRWLALIAALSGYTLFTLGIVGSFNAFSSTFSP
jgi:hypothetical protein